MPELPEVESVRRQLERAMRGKTISRVLLRRANLRRPFPEGFASRLEGQTIRSLRRRGKYLLLDLTAADALLIHLGMTGSFRVTKASGDTSGSHDHVVFELSDGSTVVFNDPRRFGVMDLVEQSTDSQHRAFKSMGMEPLDASFDAHVLARALANRKTPIKVALLDQRNVAGLGNIYASEALHRAGISPTRRSSTIATKKGLPRPAAFELAKAIKAVLRSAIARQERPYRSGDFRVYERDGEKCLKSRCGGQIRRIYQAGRSTFYCPKCQR